MNVPFDPSLLAAEKFAVGYAARHSCGGGNQSMLDSFTQRKNVTVNMNVPRRA